MARIDSAIDARFSELVNADPFPIDFSLSQPSHLSSVNINYQGVAHAWLTSSASLIELVTRRRGPHWEQTAKLMDVAGTNLVGGQIGQMRGLLLATWNDWKRGLLLGQVEFGAYAITFDDFLDIAGEMHGAGNLEGSAVLVSAVLEDAVAKIADRNGVAREKTLDPSIDSLTKAGVFQPHEAKRVKTYAGVRTNAFHARWNAIDLPAVGEAIRGVRELVEKHLT